MSRTDIIADSFTIMRNAVMVYKEDAYIPHTNALEQICRILKDEGYIETYKDIEVNNFKKIKVYFKYEDKKSTLMQIKRVSKPGRRVYMSCKDVPRTLSGHGITLLSTSSGIMTDTKARQMGLGGEVMGQVW